MEQECVTRRGKDYTYCVDETGIAIVLHMPVGAFSACRVPKPDERGGSVKRYHELGHFRVFHTSKLISQSSAEASIGKR